VNWPPILLSGLLGILGTVVGALLGPYFTKNWQREQWLREKRLTEYKELMSSMSDTYITLMQRAEVEAQREDDEPDKPWLDPLPTEKELATYKVLHDRVFIAKELAGENIMTLWETAVTNFRHTRNREKFALRYVKINEKVVGMASK
jgi:hypothetical protein